MLTTGCTRLSQAECIDLSTFVVLHTTFEHFYSYCQLKHTIFYLFLEGVKFLITWFIQIIWIFRHSLSFSLDLLRSRLPLEQRMHCLSLSFFYAADSLQAQLINMGVIPTLVKLLGLHSHNTALTEMCLIAFGNLAELGKYICLSKRIILLRW